MWEAHIVPRRCNRISADPLLPTPSVATTSPGLFGYPKSGILKMKFDPCGGEAVMAERASETAGSMSFRLHQAQYDKRSKRAYVEFRRSDNDGGDQLVVAVFTFQSEERLSKQRIREEVVRKARHVLKGAVLAA